MVNTLRALKRTQYCRTCSAGFRISGQLSHHARNCVGTKFHCKHKCKYCPMTFEKQSRSFKAHEKKCKMFADLSRKLEDEAVLIPDSAPQVAVPIPPDVVTLASALTHNSGAPDIAMLAPSSDATVAATSPTEDEAGLSSEGFETAPVSDAVDEATDDSYSLACALRIFGSGFFSGPSYVTNNNYNSGYSNNDHSTSTTISGNKNAVTNGDPLEAFEVTMMNWGNGSLTDSAAHSTRSSSVSSPTVEQDSAQSNMVLENIAWEGDFPVNFHDGTPHTATTSLLTGTTPGSRTATICPPIGACWTPHTATTSLLTGPTPGPTSTGTTGTSRAVSHSPQRALHLLAGAAGTTPGPTSTETIGTPHTASTSASVSLLTGTMPSPSQELQCHHLSSTEESTGTTGTTGTPRTTPGPTSTGTAVFGPASTRTSVTVPITPPTRTTPDPSPTNSNSEAADSYGPHPSSLFYDSPPAELGSPLENRGEEPAINQHVSSRLFQKCGIMYQDSAEETTLARPHVTHRASLPASRNDTRPHVDQDSNVWPRTDWRKVPPYRPRPPTPKPGPPSAGTTPRTALMSLSTRTTPGSSLTGTPRAAPITLPAGTTPGPTSTETTETPLRAGQKPDMMFGGRWEPPGHRGGHTLAELAGIEKYLVKQAFKRKRTRDHKKRVSGVRRHWTPPHGYADRWSCQWK